MPSTVRLLGSGDEPMLVFLAAEEAAFDLEQRSTASTPPTAADAAAYLSDPAVLHWIAEDDRGVVGFSLCYLLRRRAGAARELLLFEIGVRKDARRQGTGTALIHAMRSWMEQEHIAEAWVLADNPGAEAFYAACGFARDEEQGVQMLLTLGEGDVISPGQAAGE